MTTDDLDIEHERSSRRVSMFEPKFRWSEAGAGEIAIRCAGVPGMVQGEQM